MPGTIAIIVDDILDSTATEGEQLEAMRTVRDDLVDRIKRVRLLDECALQQEIGRFGVAAAASQANNLTGNVPPDPVPSFVKGAV